MKWEGIIIWAGILTLHYFKVISADAATISYLLVMIYDRMKDGKE